MSIEMAQTTRGTVEALKNGVAGSSLCSHQLAWLVRP